MNNDAADLLHSAVSATGCAACGWTAAGETDKAEADAFRSWLEKGYHAGMGWLENHASLRCNPENVLEGVRTVFCFAFRFPRPENARHSIAAYALGRDYHKALKSRLRPFCAFLEHTYGARTRICVDSAPLPERYWAFRTGIACRGRNGMALVEGCGPYAFLAEVLSDMECPVPPPKRTAVADACRDCGACMAACPTGALKDDASVDASRCLSYLSIEHKGEFPADVMCLIDGMDAAFPLLGCDRCLSACPLGRDCTAPVMTDFEPRPGIVSLTPERLSAMTDGDIERLCAGTALRRAGAEALRRNAAVSLKAAGRTGDKFP